MSFVSVTGGIFESNNSVYILRVETFIPIKFHNTIVYNAHCYNYLFIDSPVLLSFPHFYMGDKKLRDAVLGMDPPEADKHEFYIDIQPVSTYFL